jgi:hypothetical protein
MSAPELATYAGPAARRVAEAGTALALAGWVVATAVSQHPNRAFDRLRRFDRTGVAIPNWRFFAPEPATHDFRVLHRYLCADGTQTEWQESNVISQRAWRQSFWFPDRRRDKAMSDICNEIIGHLRTPGQDLTVTPAYRILRDFVAARLAATHTGPDPQGFQFLVVSDCGYDDETEPDYLFASRFEKWQPSADS